MKYILEFNKFFENIETTFANFDINVMRNLTSFKSREKYCNETLQRISSGSSRIVYKINDKMVLKLAKNKKGFIQNDLEADIARTYAHITTEIYEDGYNQKTHNYDYVISELAKNINIKRFYELTGVHFEKFCAYLDLMYYQNNPSLDKNKMYVNIAKNKISKEEMEIINVDDENIFHGVFDLLMCYDMGVGDLTRIGSYGEVIRNNIPCVVLRDYGANNEYFKK
jgi:hypothetical protein